MLLLAIVTASVPLHQIFHKHIYSSSSSINDDRTIYKTPDTSCCDSLQVITNAILVSFYEADSIFLIPTSVSYFYPPNFSTPLHLFLNKAPPVVLA